MPDSLPRSSTPPHESACANSAWPDEFLLSVVMPVYNEAPTLRQLVERVEATGVPCEIVAVDDASTDATPQILSELAAAGRLRVFRHDTNRGKGAAIRTGLKEVRGNVVIIQDADLEYNPQEYGLLLAPILEDRADVVYGSRFSGNDRPVAKYWHQTGNRLVTWISNICTNLKLTDVETCYKVMRRELVEQVSDSLQENGFGIELELTAKLAKLKKVRFHERPISYSPRGYAEGKKIRWQDAFRAIWCAIRYSFG